MRPLRHHLVALVLIALVPTLLFAGAVVWSLGREQRASVETGLQTTVRALAIAVEEEIAASVRVLEVLATSTALDGGDLRTFHEQAKRAARAHGAWYAVALTDARGQLLLSSLRPWGARLPSIADRGYFQDVIQRGRPAVSDLIAGRTTGTANVTVAVPVLRDGAVRYVLFSALDSDSVGRILAAQRIPADWIASITDRHQVFIARNRDQERYVGRELIEPLKQAVRAADAGAGRYPVFDSPDVYAAWQRTSSLGWTVTLGAPVSAVDVPLRRSLWRLALGGLVVILVGGASTIVLGQRISRSMGALASAADALGRGARPRCAPSPISEVDAVGHAMERAGETIDERTAELRSSQARLKRLVDCSPIGILVGEDDLVTDANDAFLKMLGYSHEDVRNGTLRWPHLRPPGSVAAADATTMARPGGEFPAYEEEFVRRDGTRVPVLVAGAFLDGTGREWVSFTLDLTERTRLEAERALRLEAQAANQAKDEFLAILSHELRAPLSTVLTSVPALRHGPLGESKAVEILDRIDRSTRLQAKLIDDLLDASRIVVGKLRIDKRPVHLAPIVAAAVGALAPEAHGKGVELTAALDTPLQPVVADAERLHQIALNLVANAIKFTPPGGRVEVSLGSRGARAVLTVRDTGRGIEPDLLPHIFDRFRQGATGKGQGGLGLGLAIVRHLVEAHDGTIHVESPGPGEGATFTVELPVHAAEGNAGESAA